MRRKTALLAPSSFWGIDGVDLFNGTPSRDIDAGFFKRRMDTGCSTLSNRCGRMLGVNCAADFLGMFIRTRSRRTKDWVRLCGEDASDDAGLEVFGDVTGPACSGRLFSFLSDDLRGRTVRTRSPSSERAGTFKTFCSTVGGCNPTRLIPDDGTERIDSVWLLFERGVSTPTETLKSDRISP